METFGNAFTVTLFQFSMYFSGSVVGGFLTAVSFFYNHSEVGFLLCASERVKTISVAPIYMCVRFSKSVEYSM